MNVYGCLRCMTCTFHVRCIFLRPHNDPWLRRVGSNATLLCCPPVHAPSGHSRTSAQDPGRPGIVINVATRLGRLGRRLEHGTNQVSPSSENTSEGLCVGKTNSRAAGLAMVGGISGTHQPSSFREAFQRVLED